MKDGKHHGKGELIFHDGSKIEGIWKNDGGILTVTLSNGKSFQCEFICKDDNYLPTVKESILSFVDLPSHYDDILQGDPWLKEIGCISKIECIEKLEGIHHLFIHLLIE